jgi:hypothetical protein
MFPRTEIQGRPQRLQRQLREVPTQRYLMLFRKNKLEVRISSQRYEVGLGNPPKRCSWNWASFLKSWAISRTRRRKGSFEEAGRKSHWTGGKSSWRREARLPWTGKKGLLGQAISRTRRGESEAAGDLESMEAVARIGLLVDGVEHDVR